MVDESREPKNEKQKLGQTEFPKIPDLEILSFIGQGGMSQVYKGRQVLLDRIVAVKVLSADLVDGDQELIRFKREATLSAALKHPNVIETYAYGVTEGKKPFIVMEFIEGRTLASEIESHAPLTFRKFKSIFIPILDALQHAHLSGVVHRDIKPSNIMLYSTDIGGEQIKLLDFGIARSFGSDTNLHLTRTGEVIGSPAFMSPEQCQGQDLNGKSDLYSLSCVMYQALTGEVPCVGKTSYESMLKHVNKPLPDSRELSHRMEIPESLTKLILWGLAKNPNDRPQNAQAFATKLETALDEITLDKSPSVSVAKKRKSAQPRLLVLTSCFLAIAAFYVARQQTPLPPPRARIAIASYFSEFFSMN